MNNPLQNRGEDERRNTVEKIISVVDLAKEIVLALLRIFGRRKEDQKY